MSYSITPILHNAAGNDKLHKLQFRVIYNRKKYYAKTNFRLKGSQLKNGRVENHSSAKSINAALDIHRVEIESRILELIKTSTDTDENIREAVSGVIKSSRLTDVTKEIIKQYRDRLSNNTLHNYTVSTKKLNEFSPGILLKDCTALKLGEFEQWMRAGGYHINTVSKYLQMIKSVLNKAAKSGMVEKKIFDNYRRPKSVQSVPVWLTEEEINDLSNVVFSVKDEYMQQAGYYFLLSCYTGYRMGDAKRFDYSNAFIDDMLIIRADKNKRIVSIPVFDKLRKILDYCKDCKLELSEQKTREHVKTLCRAAGIKKDVKFHSARHSFAMLLMSKGFTIDEVSEFIGDTPLVTKVYARIHKGTLNQKVMDRFS